MRSVNAQNQHLTEAWKALWVEPVLEAEETKSFADDRLSSVIEATTERTLDGNLAFRILHLKLGSFWKYCIRGVVSNVCQVSVVEVLEKRVFLRR